MKKKFKETDAYAMMVANDYDDDDVSLMTEEESEEEHEDLVVALPRPVVGSVPLEEALRQRWSARGFAGAPLPLEAAAQFLWAAQGVTEGKYRTVPSAGALYPLEVYLVAGDVRGLEEPGVYRYVPRRHELVGVQGGDVRAALARAALQQRWIARAPAVVVIAAVYERCAAKYGRRATRYVHVEVGHAAQNVYLQAAALGSLGTRFVGAFDDALVQRLLGLPADHAPLALMPIGAVLN